MIEVNPRVSRSSALASKATGYPIARVAAQIAVGRRLDEIPNAVTGKTVAAFEPALDYVVVKLPRFPFDKFPGAERGLGSQMKATGEVMAIERTFGAALNKALRGLEQAGAGWLSEQPEWAPDLDALTAHTPDFPSDSAISGMESPATARLASIPAGSQETTEEGGQPVPPSGYFPDMTEDRRERLARFLRPSDSRLWRVIALLRRGLPADVIQGATGIAPWFVSELDRLVGLGGPPAHGRAQFGRRAAGRRQARRLRRPRHRDADRPDRRQN